MAKVRVLFSVDEDVRKGFVEAVDRIFGERQASHVIENFMKVVIAIERFTSNLEPDFYDKVAKFRSVKPEVSGWMAPLHVLGDRNKDLITYLIQITGNDNAVVEFDRYVASLKQNNTDSTADE